MLNDSDGDFLLSTEHFWESSVEAAAGNSDPSHSVLFTPTDQ